MNEMVVVEERNGVPMVSSRQVAEVFGKRHADVLREINRLKNEGVDNEFNERNFALVEYQDAKGEMRPEYWLTKDGFTFLVMGFTGANADRYKIAYINRFNAMENYINKIETLNGKSKEHRRGLTDQWKDHGARGSDYGYLTKKEYEVLEFERGKKKAEMDKKEKAKLSAFECMEMWKLINNQQIQGKNQLAHSIERTGAMMKQLVAL